MLDCIYKETVGFLYMQYRRELLLYYLDSGCLPIPLSQTKSDELARVTNKKVALCVGF